MKITRESIVVFIFTFIVIGLAIGLPFATKPDASIEPVISLSQLAFSAVAFFIAFIALYITIIQLRKNLAKPKIKIIFSENGKTVTDIYLHSSSENSKQDHELKLSVINTGNAITSLFQINFFIPNLYNPRLDATSQLITGAHRAPVGPAFEIDNEIHVVSILNTGSIICFVNKTVQISSILISTFTNKTNEYPDELTINYRVYGDWQETQKGKLQLSISKEEPHA